MNTTVFGKLPDGRDVHRYTLTNRSGATAEIIDYGAAITSLRVPDRNGKIQRSGLRGENRQGHRLHQVIRQLQRGWRDP